MADHPNVERMRKGYDAFGRGDMDYLRNEMFADDVVFHVAGDNPLAGEYKGMDEVFGFFGRLMQESGGTFSLEIHDVLANDEHGIGLVHVTAEREGRRLDQNAAHVFHLRDGKITESWSMVEDSRAGDEFWS
jgi:ketosteroid isomerase-like protein